MRYLENDEVTEQMVIDMGDDIQGEDDRDLGPVPGSWFLSSPKAQVCPGLRRGGARPRRFCLHRNPITVSKVSYQASQPRFSRKLETHFAINFFCNPWKHLQPRLTLRVYAHFIARMSVNLLFTHTMHFLLSIPSIKIHLLWWELGMGRSDLRNWDLRQKKPWRVWQSPRSGGARARSRGRPGSSWCRCRSWRLASCHCCWCRSHHSPGHLRAASEYLPTSPPVTWFSFCELEVFLKFL